jgi:hypothetical protein
MLAQGIALKVASERVGHATTGITADTYQHVSEEPDRGAAEAIDRLLQPLLTKGGRSF